MKSHHHNYLIDDESLIGNERRTLIVVWLTFVMMVVEVIAGWMTGSMALLADGWHMASHAGALGISYFAYRLARSPEWSLRFSFGAGKFIPLGGYTSSILLGIIAVLMGVESVSRLIGPVEIHFNEALVVAVAGLAVNVVSVMILGWHSGHDSRDHAQIHHHDHDHNLRAAYLHVIADALTSVFAIVALLVGKFYGWMWLDAVMGIAGGVIIIKWALSLMRETAWELLDGHARHIDVEAIRSRLMAEGVRVGDLHVWRIAPGAHACEVVLYSVELRGPDHYHDILREAFGLKHVVVEEHAL